MKYTIILDLLIIASAFCILTSPVQASYTLTCIAVAIIVWATIALKIMRYILERKLIHKENMERLKKEVEKMSAAAMKYRNTVMQITRKSTLSGIETTLYLPVTEEQMQQFYSGKDLLQNIFPNLTAYQRDFMKSGFTEDEWKRLYLTEDDQ